MKLAIRIPDNIYEMLEIAADKAGNKNIYEYVEKHIALLLQIESGPRIVLKKEHLAKMSDIVGGKVFKTADDVTSMFVNNFRISVDGEPINICVEDAYALREQFESSGRPEYKQYVSDVINEALSTYLWGSTRGLIGK
jgi:hypothetical protein